MDDDARADPHWLSTACEYLDRRPDVLALGGPDPAPSDSTESELISDTLLATPLIGSGVAAHEGRRGIFPIRSASDIALVNLFVRRSAFTGFDESIGYIGEDTRLIEQLMERGTVMYHDSVIVFHRRRAFPGPYLRQRWRYRVKTGQMIRAGSRSHRRNPKIIAFLALGTVALVLAPLMAIPYAVLTLVLGVPVTKLRAGRWWMLPFAFAAHHLVYYFGILRGISSGQEKHTHAGS